MIRYNIILSTAKKTCFQQIEQRNLPAQVERKQHEQPATTYVYERENLSALAARAVTVRTAMTKKSRRTSHNHRNSTKVYTKRESIDKVKKNIISTTEDNDYRKTMDIFKIIFAIVLMIETSSAAREPPRRNQLLQFVLPKHKQSLRLFMMLQEPWHLNILRDLEDLIDGESGEYSPMYDLYKESIESFLEAFKVYSRDDQNCAKAEHLIETIGKTRELLFTTEDTKFKKILQRNTLDPLDVYEHYTLEFYDRFAKEFLNYESSLSKAEEEREQHLIKWFDNFIDEKNFLEKTQKFTKFFSFFEDEMKYETSVCKCLL
ncbi:uncharacterized protein [Musca autumnalis]|uniref:uncharacterized protein n=1 Tax=Musca autumnalis TaxID=221902 RepID=UPI003CF88F55